MKHLILTFTLLLCLSAISQEGKRNHHHKRTAHNLSAEQLATLKTKKMTLFLDLTPNQQKEVLKVNLGEAEYRKARIAEQKERKQNNEDEKLSANEKYELQNAILDRKIAQQEKMKEILNDAQFSLWKKGRNQKGMHSRKNMQRGGRKG